MAQRQFDILSQRERGIEAHQPDFNEALYEHLKATPWWLASIGIHLVGGFVLNLLVGSGGASAAAMSEMQTTLAQDVPEMEEEIEPDVLETKPIDEQEKVVDTPQLTEAKVEDTEAEVNEVDSLGQRLRIAGGRGLEVVSRDRHRPHVCSAACGWHRPSEATPAKKCSHFPKLPPTWSRPPES